MKKLVIVFCIFIAAIYIKINYYDHNTSFLSSDGFNIFRTESAMRYHYASLVSEGKSIPEIDVRAQYPEGLRVKDRIKLTTEYVSGFIYNFVSHDIPFHIYLAYFMFIISSITVFTVYFLSKKLAGNSWAAVVPCIFLITAFAWYARTVSGGFVEEDFALPFIFLSFLFFFLRPKEGQKRKWIIPLLSGFFIFIPLTSWHLTQFYYIIFLLFIIIEFFLRFNERDDLLKPFLFMAGFCIFGGMFVPTLRAEGFLFSYSMLLTYVLIIVWLISKMFNSNRLFSLGVFVILTALALFGFAVLTSKHSGDYNHVYQLVYYKIRYLGAKPEDPSGMPFDAKVFWQAGFLSPALKDIITAFAGVLLAAAFGIGLTLGKLIKRNTTMLEEGLLFFFFAFIPLYLLFERLYVFLIVFIVPFTALLYQIKIFNDTKIKKLVVSVFLIFTLAFQSWYGFTKDLKNNDAGVQNNLIVWLKDNAKENDAVLANFGISAQIFAYANKPITLHPMFETTDIRAKTKDCYENFYKSEDEFYALCKKYKVRYFVYEWQLIFDKSKDSVRYQINQNTVNKDCAVSYFHFFPEKLKKFALMFQNQYYRVYRVNADGEAPGIQNTVEYFPFYNPKLFVLNDGTNILNDGYNKAVVDKIWLFPQNQQKAIEYRKEGKMDLAEAEYKKVLEIDPFFNAARVNLAEFYLSVNRLQECANECKKALTVDRQYVDAYYILSQALYKAGQIDNAYIVLKEAQRIAPDNPGVKTGIMAIEAEKNAKANKR